MNLNNPVVDKYYKLIVIGIPTIKLHKYNIYMEVVVKNEPKKNTHSKQSKNEIKGEKNGKSSEDYMRLQRAVDGLTKKLDALETQVKKSHITISVESKAFLKMLIAQMQNPEAVDLMGKAIGIPDPEAQSLNTYLRSAVIDLELNPDSGGEFQIMFNPNIRNCLHVSGVTLGDQSTTNSASSATSADIFLVYAPPDSHGSNDVRISPSYVPGTGCFVLYKGAAYTVFSSLATVPLTFKSGDIMTVTKSIIIYPAINSYYWVNNGSFLTGVTANMTATIAQTVISGNMKVALFGSTSEPPTFDPAVDTALVTSTITTGDILSWSMNATNLTTYKTFWIGWSNNTTYQNTVLTMNLSFNGLTPINDADTLVGDGSTFSYDAFDIGDDDIEQCRLVSASVLLQNRTPKILAGGNEAEIMQHASPPEIASNSTYAGMTEEHQSHVGDLANGMYAYWTPTSWEDWKLWKDPGDNNLISEENTIVIAGQAPISEEGINTVLHVRVYMLWQLITYDRKFNPTQKTYMPPGIPIGELETILYAGLGMVPKCTCNPKHTDITEFILNIKKTGKSGYKVLKQLGDWGSYAFFAATELFALL